MTVADLVNPPAQVLGPPIVAIVCGRWARKARQDAAGTWAFAGARQPQLIHVAAERAGGHRWLRQRLHGIARRDGTGPDAFDGGDRDAIGLISHRLEEIAEDQEERWRRGG